MADGPWKCSACGTINEPVANSCRTCGRWPSLFDLQESVVDEIEIEDPSEPAPVAGFPPLPSPYEPEVLEPEPFEPVEPEPFEMDGDPDEEAEPEDSSRRRQLARYLVPLAIFVFIVISNIVNR
jgi:hypothetical protein